jgi:hypothetical protein
MRYVFAFIAAATMLLAGCASPKDTTETKYTVEDLDKMVAIRQNIEMLDKLKLQGVEADKDGSLRAALLNEAKTIVGRDVTFDDITEITGDDNAPPTAWEKAKGVLTFANVLWVFGATMFGLAIMWLFGIYFITLIMMIPANAWEVILWGGMLGLSFVVGRIEPDWQLALLMPVCLGFVGCVHLTCYLHGKKSDSYEIPSGILTAIWGTLAVYYGSHVVGFMAVMAALSTLGFVCGHLPGMVYVGFNKDDAVFRSTFAAGLMVVAHVLLTITGTAAQHISVFREGMSFMGSFCFFLGVLIMSSKWYWWTTKTNHEDNKVERGYDWNAYFVMQAFTIVCGVTALYLGSVFGMSAIAGFGGTFFCLYILEKYYEIPWTGAGWAWSLLGLGLILYLMGVLVKAHPQYFLIG